MNAVADALKGMTKRQLEELHGKIERELRTCVLCGTEGARTFKVRDVTHSSGRHAAMRFCDPCFEKHRVPESRAGSGETG